MNRIERGDADERLAVRQRKALHGRDADAHSGERSRPRRDREQIHIRDAKTVRVQQTHADRLASARHASPRHHPRKCASVPPSRASATLPCRVVVSRASTSM